MRMRVLTFENLEANPDLFNMICSSLVKYFAYYCLSVVFDHCGLKKNHTRARINLTLAVQEGLAGYHDDGTLSQWLPYTCM